MTTWRAHLAVMLARDIGAAPIGTIGAIGMGAETLNALDGKAATDPFGTIGTIGIGVAGEIAAHLRAAEAAAKALAAGYGDGEHDQAEREALAAFYAADSTPHPQRPASQSLPSETCP